MKKSAYLVAFLVILTTFLPWIDGVYVKQQLLDNIAHINKISPDSITLVEYHTGWLHSDAKLQIGQKSSLPLTLSVRLTHGPIAYDDTKKQFVTAMVIAQGNMTFPNANGFSASGQATLTATQFFNKQLHYQYYLPSMRYQAASKIDITWQGLTGEASVTMKNDYTPDTVRSNTQFGALQVDSVGSILAMTHLRIQPITLSYQGTLHPLHFWIGTYQLTTTNISLLDTKNRELNITGLDLTSKDDVSNDNLYHSVTDLAVQKIEITGTEIPLITSSKLHATINNLNAKKFGELKQLTNQQLSPHPIAKNSSSIIANLLALVTPNTSITLDESLDTPLGSLVINMNQSLSQISNLNSVAEIGKNIQSQTNIRIAIPLAKKLVDLYQGVSDTNKINAVSDNEANIEKFNEQIAGLMKAGKLPLSSSIAIMSLRSQSQTADQFIAGLTALKLNASITSEITTIYQQTQTATSAPANNTDNIIADWLKQGLLIQDNNDYILEIKQVNGVVTINGKSPPP